MQVRFLPSPILYKGEVAQWLTLGCKIPSYLIRLNFPLQTKTIPNLLIKFYVLCCKDENSIFSRFNPFLWGDSITVLHCTLKMIRKLNGNVIGCG